MEIQFPRYLSWKVILDQDNPSSKFGKQTSGRITRSIPILKKAGYEFVFEEVDDAYLDKFVPLYEEFISSKERGTIFPIRERVAGWRKDGEKVNALSLYKQTKFIGGLIFSIEKKTNLLSVNYKVLPHSIEEKMPISVSFVAEFYLRTYALEHGFLAIGHGTDRNIYGYHSNIGLVAFKLQIGCQPFIPTTRVSTGEPNQILTTIPIFDEDMFIFLGHTHEVNITQAALISPKPEEELKKKFPILFSNTCFETKIISPSDVSSTSDWK